MQIHRWILCAACVMVLARVHAQDISPAAGVGTGALVKPTVVPQNTKSGPTKQATVPPTPTVQASTTPMSPTIQSVEFDQNFKFVSVTTGIGETKKATTIPLIEADLPVLLFGKTLSYTALVSVEAFTFGDRYGVSPPWKSDFNIDDFVLKTNQEWSKVLSTDLSPSEIVQLRFEVLNRALFKKNLAAIKEVLKSLPGKDVNEDSLSKAIEDATSTLLHPDIDSPFPDPYVDPRLNLESIKKDYLEHFPLFKATKAEPAPLANFTKDQVDFISSRVAFNASLFRYNEQLQVEGDFDFQKYVSVEAALMRIPTLATVAPFVFVSVSAQKESIRYSDVMPLVSLVTHPISYLSRNVSMTFGRSTDNFDAAPAYAIGLSTRLTNSIRFYGETLFLGGQQAPVGCFGVGISVTSLDKITGAVSSVLTLGSGSASK
jgi:hypothetical protein